MNKRGSHGIINCTGSPGDPAELVDCREKDFLQNIEDGILSTVVVLLNKGLYTVSSCQGHDVSCPYRSVSIVDEISIIRWFQQAVYRINSNESFKKPITYFILPYQTEDNLYDGCFQDPCVIDINFGDYRDNETIIKQHAFEMFINTHLIEGVSEKLSNETVRYRLSNDDHIDVFTHSE